MIAEEGQTCCWNQATREGVGWMSVCVRKEEGRAQRALLKYLAGALAVYSV